MRSTSEGRARPPLEIGWQEWARLPDFCKRRIKAKIDTGAKTSALHAFRLREMTVDGAAVAEFYLHPAQRKSAPEYFCRAPIVDRRLIRSSNGAGETRLIVRTRLKLGCRIWPIEISLTNRDDMGYRLLIGRDALKRSVLVRPSRSFLLGR